MSSASRRVRTPRFARSYFVGAWLPEAADFDFGESLPSSAKLIQGSNYFLLSSRSPFGDGGLAWSRPEGWAGSLEALAFRGYLLLPRLTSRSPQTSIFDYWDRTEPRQHNGVFAAALVREDGVTLVQDAFGISPLYHRECGRGILFSTNPRLLASTHDQPDPVSWRGLLQAGYVPGDRALTLGVSRCRAGHEHHITRHGHTTRCWFDFAGLSGSSESIGGRTLDEVEGAFQRAMDRCIALADAGWSLPLSGGDDSRRILTALVRRGVDFDSMTVRVFQKGGKDLDAPAATQLAERFGFRNQVIDLPDVQQWATADSARRVLMDGETNRHTWSVFLWRSVNDRPRLLFDGLGGDVVGETGFAHPGLYTGSEPQKVALLTSLVIGGGLHDNLNSRFWASLGEVRDDLRDFLARLPRGDNWPDLAFLLLRTRRHIAPASQSLVGAGHLITYPYLDLDYVRAALRIDPKQRIDTSLQALCLERHWPEYFAFSGSRRISPTAPVNATYRSSSRLACLRRMRNEIDLAGSSRLVASWLSTKGRLVATAARWSDTLASHQGRWLFPVLSLGSREGRARAFAWNS